jgi:hypothetical protein
MENTKWKGVLRTGSIITMAAFAFSQPVSATEAIKDVSKEISDMRGAVASIDLYTVSNDMVYRVRLDEKDVVDRGCRYKATARADVDALIDLLVDAQFAQRPPDDYSREPRIVVHLRMRNGDTIPLVLTREFDNAPASGTFARTLVTSRMGFGAELRRWQLQRKPENGDALSCKEKSQTAHKAPNDGAAALVGVPPVVDSITLM